MNKEFEKSNLASFIQYMDNFFYKLGIISSNIDPIENEKWESYYVLGLDNMFSHEAETINATDRPIKRKEAEEKLAGKIIELLSFIDMSEVNKRNK